MSKYQTSICKPKSTDDMCTNYRYMLDINLTQDRSWLDIEKIPYINEHIKQMQS